MYIFICMDTYVYHILVYICIYRDRVREGWIQRARRVRKGKRKTDRQRETDRERETKRGRKEGRGGERD